MKSGFRWAETPIRGGYDVEMRSPGGWVIDRHVVDLRDALEVARNLVLFEPMRDYRVAYTDDKGSRRVKAVVYCRGRKV